MPSVIARDSVEGMTADSGTASGADAADVQKSEEHRVAAALLALLQTERDSLETSADLVEGVLADFPTRSMVLHGKRGIPSQAFRAPRHKGEDYRERCARWSESFPEIRVATKV